MAKRGRNRRRAKRNFNKGSKKQTANIQQRNNNEVNTSVSGTLLIPIMTTPVKKDTPKHSHSFILSNKINNHLVRSRSNPFITPKSRNLIKDLNCTNLDLYDDAKDAIASKFQKHSLNLSPCNLVLESRRSMVGNSKFRSNSSIAKLHSPELEKIPIKVNVSTQTVYFNNTPDVTYIKETDLSKEFENTLTSFAHIFETPKIRHELSAFTQDLGSYIHNFNTFSPNLCGNHIQNESPMNNFFNISKSQFVFRPNKCHSKTFKPLDFVQKNLLRSNNFNTPTFMSSTPNLNDSVFKSSKTFSYNKHRVFKNISPKSDKISNKSIPRSKYQKEDYEVPKSFTPTRKCRLEKSGNFLNVSKGNNNILARIRKFHHKYTSKSTAKIYEVCLWLGLTVKRGILALKDSLVTCKSLSKSTSTPAQRCNEEIFKTQIVELNRKVEDMNTEMAKNKLELSQQIVDLNAKIEDLQRDVQKRVEEMIKAAFKEAPKICNNFVPPPPPPLPACGPPPPAPPPPPPMPAMAFTSTPLNRIPKIKKSASEKKENENARPIISLDDILKVKLRKPGCAAVSGKPALLRRATQAVISTEMLKQVKLRPASRAHTPIHTTQRTPLNRSSTSLSNSPVSSLTRILSNVDTNENVRGES